MPNITHQIRTQAAKIGPTLAEHKKWAALVTIPVFLPVWGIKQDSTHTESPTVDAAPAPELAPVGPAPTLPMADMHSDFSELMTTLVIIGMGPVLLFLLVMALKYMTNRRY